MTRTRRRPLLGIVLPAAAPTGLAREAESTLPPEREVVRHSVPTVASQDGSRREQLAWQ